ncbi:molybdenum cofactor guanylyltransferase [Phycicoccus flavus]|uniref:molybdenum cofactor guanylyltransferase n=1 Tax=Phycicoccus flavus TaxID=2502783 RepID=UPI000FEBFD08|nr:NTP transferase domain-containing protein [Phycicoccus flavus]NHA69570.1 NTP transferase domain-containing protein [Phycicoccus flavus]
MTPPPDAPVTVVVLAGGRSTRFGADKLAAPLRGTTVLDHLLSALPPEWPVVAVGTPRETVRGVRWTREDPPGGGPLAAVLAGVALCRTGTVAVVAGDMPDAAPALARLLDVLLAAGPEVEAAVAVDDEDVANPLLAVYRTAALAARAGTPTAGVPARSLLDLVHAEVVVTGRPGRDVDTPADLAGFDEHP